MSIVGPLPRRAIAKPACPTCKGSGEITPTSTPDFLASWWSRSADPPGARPAHCTDYGHTRLDGKYLCGLPMGNDGVFSTVVPPAGACDICTHRFLAGETTPVGGLKPRPCECVRYFVLNAVCWGWFCPNTPLCGVFNSDEKSAGLVCRTCGTARPFADLAGRPVGSKEAQRDG